MTTWWTKIGCFLTGWNSNILKNCTESSYKQLKKYTSAILILMIIWAGVGYLFAERYIHAPWWGCISASFIALTVVIQIEKQIILTVGRNIKLKIFRYLIAFIMAILGSVILDQIIFKDDVQKKMVEIVDRQVNEQLPNRLLIINTELLSLQNQIDSVEKVNLTLNTQIAKQPSIKAVSSVTVHQKTAMNDGTFKDTPQTTIKVDAIPNPKIKEVETNNKHLTELYVQKESWTQRKLKAETDLRIELQSKQGFLEELGALIEILIQKPVALGFYLVLFIFFMSLELFVVMSKSDEKNKCDYDLIVEHQLIQKKKMLEELKN